MVEVVHKAAVTKLLHEGLDRKNTAAGTTINVKLTDTIQLQESLEQIGGATVSKPQHECLQEFTANRHHFTAKES